MPFLVNGFSLGQDLDLTIRDDRGTVIGWWQLGHGMEFEANRDDVELKVVPITTGGKPLFDSIPAGWSGRIMWTRVNGNISNMWAAIDFNFYNFARRQFFTLNTRVLNRDGSTDQYTFTRVSLSKGGFGNFRADKEVDQSLTFRAQEMLNTGSLVPPIVGVGP